MSDMGAVMGETPKYSKLAHYEEDHKQEQESSFASAQDIIRDRESPRDSIGRVPSPSKLELIQDPLESCFKSARRASPTPNYKTRCTIGQVYALVDYMARHPLLATSRYTSLACGPHLAEWRQLSKYLNNMGTAKSTASWKRTWRDLKRKALKDRSNALASNSSINKVSKRILEIIPTDEDPTMGDMLTVGASPECFKPGHNGKEQQESKIASGQDVTRDHESQRDLKDRASSLSPSLQDDSSLNTEYYKPQMSPERRSTVEASPPSSLGQMSPAHNSDESSASDNEGNEKEQDPETQREKNQAFKSKTKKPSYEDESPSPQIEMCEEYLSEFSEPNEENHDADPKLSPRSRESMSPPQLSREASPVQSVEQSRRVDNSLKTRHRCNPTQIRALLKYMVNHPGLATAKGLNIKVGIDKRYKEWQRLGRYLNTLKTNGPNRSTNSWKATWRDLISRARKKESKLSRSYDTVYHKVLKIVNSGRTSKKTTVTKVTMTQEIDTRPQSPSDPLNLKSEQDYTDVTQTNHTQMSLRRRNSGMSPMQRGSRLSPMRCVSDQVSAVRRNSDTSLDYSSEIHPHSESLESSAMDVNDASLAEFDNYLKDSKARDRRSIMRSSNKQLRALADYMLTHQKLAKDQYLDHRQTVAAWVRLARYLNQIGPVRRPTEAWKRTWRDIKIGVRARGRNQAPKSSCLEAFREQRVLEMIGRASPFRDDITKTGENIEAVYVVREPEGEIPHNPNSPHAKCDVSENLGPSSPRNDFPENERKAETASTEQTSSMNDTNILLQTLIKEVRRSNELNIEQNSYLKEILLELRTSNRATKEPDRETKQTNNTKTNVMENERMVNTTKVMLTHATRSQCSDKSSNNNGAANCSPFIRPVALTSLRSINTHEYRQMDVRSILSKFKGHMPKRKLVRLKDGTMVLVPEVDQMKTATNHEHNGVMGSEEIDVNKSGATENSTTNNES